MAILRVKVQFHLTSLFSYHDSKNVHLKASYQDFCSTVRCHRGCVHHLCSLKISHVFFFLANKADWKKWLTFVLHFCRRRTRWLRSTAVMDPRWMVASHHEIIFILQIFSAFNRQKMKTSCWSPAPRWTVQAVRVPLPLSASQWGFLFFV